eukprot:7935917-Pyramimonas_sp.AAC.2
MSGVVDRLASESGKGESSDVKEAIKSIPSSKPRLRIVGAFPISWRKKKTKPRFANKYPAGATMPSNAARPQVERLFFLVPVQLASPDWALRPASTTLVSAASTLAHV